MPNRDKYFWKQLQYQSTGKWHSWYSQMVHQVSNLARLWGPRVHRKIIHMLWLDKTYPSAVDMKPLRGWILDRQKRPFLALRYLGDTGSFKSTCVSLRRHGLYVCVYSIHTSIYIYIYPLVI